MIRTFINSEIKEINMIDLMQARVKCIGHKDKHYPGSPFEIGDILILDKYADGKSKYGLLDGEGFPDILLSESIINDHPHLFSPLPWWEDRAESEMPEYVKVVPQYHTSLFENVIYKVKRWIPYEINPSISCTIEGKDDIYRFNAIGLLPTTSSEYIEYKKQKA